MKRVWVMITTASGLLLGGCGLNDYNDRLDETLLTLTHKQALNANLEKPALGKFKELDVYVRPPKPSAESGSAWTLPPGSFDHAASFLATAKPGVTKEGETAPALPPLKMNVLVRVKPKKSTSKKSNVAPPESNPNRGSFVADVRAVMASDYGAEAANDKSPQNVKKGNTSFKKLTFTATSGDDIQAYFADANKGETEVALIFDIPPALRTNPVVVKGVEYCLESFALGTAARKEFNGGAAGNKAAAAGPGF